MHCVNHSKGILVNNMRFPEEKKSATFFAISSLHSQGHHGYVWKVTAAIACKILEQLCLPLRDSFTSCSMQRDKEKNVNFLGDHEVRLNISILS